jgi:hypothetical protein
MSDEPDDLLLAYLEGTYPVQWAAWWGRLPDGQAKLQLSSILFDENDSLRDLTDPMIRRQVVELVLDDSSLSQLVLAEIASALSNSPRDDSVNDHGLEGTSGEWKLITADQKTLENYACGVRAGDILRLRSALEILTHDRRPTGETWPPGDEHVVLFGNPSEPTTIELRRWDGETHFWNDTVLETFEHTGKRADGFPP